MIKLQATNALLKAWLTFRNISICNSNRRHIQRDQTLLSNLFLSSTFVFQFGFSYRLTKRYYHAFSNAEPLAAIQTNSSK